MAANNLAYLELRLSGGSSNADPNASLGGVRSSNRILSKSATGISNITGVTIDDAPGSADGAGTLAFVASGKTLTWTPNGGSAGAAVALSGDGRYAIPGSAGFLFVTVVDASLPGTNQSDTITVTQLANQLFDDTNRRPAPTTSRLARTRPASATARPRGSPRRLRTRAPRRAASRSRRHRRSDRRSVSGSSTPGSPTRSGKSGTSRPRPSRQPPTICRR